MATNINTQTRLVTPFEAKPDTKNVAHSSVNQETEKNTVTSEKTNALMAEKESDDNKQPVEESLNDAVKQLNQYVQSINRNLEFNIDNDSGETIVKVIDSETEELIRQIPNEEALRIAKHVDIQSATGAEDQGLLLTKLQA